VRARARARAINPMELEIKYNSFSSMYRCVLLCIGYHSKCYSVEGLDLIELLPVILY